MNANGETEAATEATTPIDGSFNLTNCRLVIQLWNLAAEHCHAISINNVREYKKLIHPLTMSRLPVNDHYPRRLAVPDKPRQRKGLNSSISLHWSKHCAFSSFPFHSCISCLPSKYSPIFYSFFPLLLFVHQFFNYSTFYDSVNFIVISLRDRRTSRTFSVHESYFITGGFTSGLELLLLSVSVTRTIHRVANFDWVSGFAAPPKRQADSQTHFAALRLNAKEASQPIPP